MEFLPPPCIMRVSADSRWQRFVITGVDGRYWSGSRWTSRLAEASLYFTKVDAVTDRNRCCLDGGGDTYTATVTVTIYRDRWTPEKLAAYLGRCGNFVLEHPLPAKAVFIEVVGGLNKVERHVESPDGSCE